MKKENNILKELYIYIPVAMLIFAITVVIILPSSQSNITDKKYEYKAIDKQSYIFETSKLGDRSLEYNYNVSEQYIYQLEKQKLYDPGKENPFAEMKTDTEAGTANGNTATGSGAGTSGTNSTTNTEK